jgi:acyl-CoA thioesterase-1
LATQPSFRLLSCLLSLTLLLTACGLGQPNATNVGVYVALGASDAVGIGATHPTQDAWVPLLAAALPSGTPVVNLGVSGATLADVIAGQLPIAADAAPRWLSLWVGPNDLRGGVSLEAFAAQLDQILSTLQPPTGTIRTMLILNLPDLRALPAFVGTDPAQLDQQVRAWNAAIASTVARYPDYAVLVDLYDNWGKLAANPQYISGDGFHPSNAGYRRIADIAVATLRAHDPTTFR